MIIFNWIGFAYLMVWAGGLGLTTKLTQERSQVLIGALLASLLVAVADFIFRKRGAMAKISKSALIHPRAGGHLFFVPIWILSIAAAGFFLLLYIR